MYNLRQLEENSPRRLKDNSRLTGPSTSEEPWIKGFGESDGSWEQGVCNVMQDLRLNRLFFSIVIQFIQDSVKSHSDTGMEKLQQLRDKIEQWHPRNAEEQLEQRFLLKELRIGCRSQQFPTWTGLVSSMDSHRKDAPACEYERRCCNFPESLNLNDEYFNTKHDQCYCQTCATHIPDVLEQDSEHGHPYEVLKGWSGFGLLVPKRAHLLKTFDNWAVSFHGCPSTVLASIQIEGQVMMPGDFLLDGTRLPNHLTTGHRW